MSVAFKITLTGGEQVPPVTTTTASGSGVAIYDSTAHTLTYTFRTVGVDWGTITGQTPQTATTADDVTGEHFHSGARGVNGPVEFDWKFNDLDDFNATLQADGSWRITGIWELTDSATHPLSDFEAGLAAVAVGVDAGLYANIHTTTNSGGEIRGQLVGMATDGADTVNGTAAADTLFGLGGADTMNGGDGNDIMDGGSGANIMHGDAGNDFLTAIGNLNVAFGDVGSDQLFFSGNQNQLFGSDGTDWLGVMGDNNALSGGNGDEVWMGATGSVNTLAGGDGQDSLYVNGTSNWLFGEGGNDWLGCSGSSNQLLGGAGIEFMGATGGGNALAGGEGGDTLLSVGSNILFGENGDDWVGASGSSNYLFGGGGNDFVAATGDTNYFDGGTGNDQLLAAAGHMGDRFIYRFGYGLDGVTGFDSHASGGTDLIDIAGFGVASFVQFQYYMQVLGGNTVISYGTDVLTIFGVTNLQESDFQLAA